MEETNRTIEFTRIRDVKMPNRANSHDAGTDFFVPNYSENFFNDLKTKNEKYNLNYAHTADSDGNETLIIKLLPGQQVLIPSGIKVNILDKNTYLEANNKSGIATKFGLLVGATVVDADYQGEVHLNVHNVSDHEVRIETGMKLVQFIHKYYINTDWKEISNEDYDMLETSDRGNRGFSSSGIK